MCVCIYIYKLVDENVCFDASVVFLLIELGYLQFLENLVSNDFKH